jgi:TonB family protein
MQFDLEDYRPDTPRVSSAISRREGVLLSLLFHALVVIAWLVMPEPQPSQRVLVPPTPSAETIRYVQILPRLEQPAPPRPQAEQSDVDRRAATQVTPPNAETPLPFSLGNTPDKVVGAPVEKPAGPDSKVPAPPSAATTKPTNGAAVRPETTPVPPRPKAGSLGSSLRNLQQFLADQNYDNPRGGQLEQDADIQFDSRGVEFGPWLRRFVAQVKRNWYVPQSAMFQRGRVVIQFNVHKDGRMTDFNVIKPSDIAPFNSSALSALKLSNPTLPLPKEYPEDKVLFTVTFYYNDIRQA